MCNNIHAFVFLLALNGEWKIVTHHALAVCSNGVIEQGEQCDDGNSFGGDGCSATCQLEDTSAWLCTNAPGSPTSCCVALINPVTNQTVCNCQGVIVDASLGYTVSPTCEKLNIDECMLGTSVCHQNAVCMDLDAASSNSTYQCICPPGLIGDGVEECQVYNFQTRFSLVKSNQQANTFNTDAFRTYLLTSGTINATAIAPRRILIDVDPYVLPSQGTRRSLLQQQVADAVLITVTIASLTAEQQAEVTATGINTANLQGDASLSVQSMPSSVTDEYDSLGEPIGTTATGFKVTGVTYNETDATWVVGVLYSHGAPNVVSTLYFPRVRQPYNVTMRNTYYVSQHPCMVSQSVCCMLDYRDKYQLGSFSANVTSNLGTCNETVAATSTLDLGFQPAGSQNAIDHALDEFPDSWIERIGAGEIKLHIAQTDLSNNGLAMKEPAPNNQQGYILTFFVGMTHFTLLPANSLSVVASQSKVQLSVTNTLTFSFATSQDYTILRYITVQIIQNKWLQSIIERKMQFVKVDFVLPVGLRQNMNTGLVPLQSIRFAIAKTQPSQLNADAWTNPCFSSDGISGMYDSALPYYNWYRQAQQQSCAIRANMCSNPPTSTLSTSTLSNSMVSFFFPVGDNVINATNMGQFPSPYYLYVYFQLSVVNSDGSVVLSNLFAKAPLDTLVINYGCESLSSEVNILATTEIDLALGFIGLEEDWNTTMRLYPDVNLDAAATNKSVIDASSTKAQSVQSNLISLILSGSPAIFSRQSASQYYLNIEQLSVMYFLDDVKFNTIMGRVLNKTAYNVVINPVTRKPRIQFASDILTTCGFDKFSCALDSNIFAGSVVLSGQVHSMATGIGNSSLEATRDWLMQNILVATDEYSKNLSTNMTGILRSKYSIDDRVRKAWFINPGHKWRRSSTGVQSQLLLSDKLIVFAVVTLNDGAGNVLRRRMLEFPSFGSSVTDNRRKLLSIPPPNLNDDARVSSALQALVEKPVTDSLPPMFFGINVPFTIASIYEEQDQKYLLLTIEAKARFDGLTVEEVNREMMRRIMANQKTVCPDCRAVYPAFENMLPSSAGVSTGRRLLQQDQQLFDGSVTVLLVYEKDSKNSVMLSYPDILASLYNSKFNGNMPKNATMLEILANLLANNHVFVKNVTAQSNQMMQIFITTEESLIISDGTIVQTTPDPAKRPKHIDVEVYGQQPHQWYWYSNDKAKKYMVCGNKASFNQDGTPKWESCEDVPSSASSSFDPRIGLIFLMASLLMFWL